MCVCVCVCICVCGCGPNVCFKAIIVITLHLKQRPPDSSSFFAAELKAIDLELDAVTESEDRDFILYNTNVDCCHLIG